MENRAAAMVLVLLVAFLGFVDVLDATLAWALMAFTIVLTAVVDALAAWHDKDAP